MLGMGNTLLHDDGVGIIVSRYLERKLTGHKFLDHGETSWGGFRIIDLLRNYDYAVIVDSIKTLSRPPGFIHRLAVKDLIPTLRLTSYHDINFYTAIRFAEKFHEKMPADIDIFAVEVLDTTTISESLSHPVRRSVSRCAAEIIKLIESKGILEAGHAGIKFDTLSEEDLLELYREPGTGDCQSINEEIHNLQPT